MNTSTHPDRGFLVVAVTLSFVAGLVVLGLGTVTELSVLRTVGLMVMGAVVLGTILTAVPVLFFMTWLDRIGSFSIHRFVGPVRRWRERAEARAAERAGAAVPIEQQYRFFATRNEPVAEPRDLLRLVKRLVRGLRRVGGPDCTLYGYTPAMKKRRVLSFGMSRVGRFLARSEIRWNFGRTRSAPTHELLFVSRFNGTHAVYLRVSFLARTSNATCPGLFVELRLTRAALGVGDADVATHCERLFRLLVETCAADSGHVELPSEPEAEGWPYVCGSGWLTYVTGTEAEYAAQRLDMTAKPCGRGTFFVAGTEPHEQKLETVPTILSAAH
jgi:hypothetical protein